MSSERHLHPVAMLIGAIRHAQALDQRTRLPRHSPPDEPGVQPADGGTLPDRRPRRRRAGGPLGVPLLAGYDLRGHRQFLSAKAGRAPEKRTDDTPGSRPVGGYRAGGYPTRLRCLEVRIETAGGGSSEPDASLSALDRAAAQALRREIEGSRRERTEEAEGPTVLRELSSRDLLIAGATSGRSGSPSLCSPSGSSSSTTSSRMLSSGGSSRPSRRTG